MTNDREKLQLVNAVTNNSAGAVDDGDGDDQRLIVFDLGGEKYGTRLIEIREVVEYLLIKPVPNTVPAFVGVCNLRGQIVGVIDLRIRFGLPTSKNDHAVLMVVETESGAIACIIDGITGVYSIPNGDIETKPNIVSVVPMKYVQGIGKWEGRLVTILDIRQMLTVAELTAIEESKILAKVD